MSAEPDNLVRQFRAMDIAELDAHFLQAAAAPALLPGNYSGTWLKRIPNQGTYRPFNLISQWFMFEILPFGITFHGDGTGIWYFFQPALAAGAFSATPGRSRWRDADCLTMTYGNAALPGPVRDFLYDEIKVLSPTHALGIGGFNQPAGIGDNFYFLLTRNN